MFCCHLECWLLNKGADVWHLIIQVHTYLLTILNLSFLGRFDFLGNGIYNDISENCRDPPTFQLILFPWSLDVQIINLFEVLFLAGGGGGVGAESTTSWYVRQPYHNVEENVAFST